MVLEITQDTFDSAVQENVEILGLSEAEAVEEAVKQFESQGVDLSKIITDIAMSKKEFEEITATVKKLEQQQKSKSTSENINVTLEVLKNQCEKGLQQKVAAGKLDAYFILLNVYEAYKDKVVRGNVLKALLALMTKQPDLLEDRGVEFIINNIKDSHEDPEIQRLLLKWTRECCIMHEMNRQKIFGAHFIDIIKSLLNETTTIEVMREVLAVSRALALDDDVRVEFGMAHEHARVIASETLCALMNLLAKFKGEEQLTLDIILTLTALMVRSEFCKKVEDAGGLDLIKNVMETFANNERIIRQCFKLIKALGGNDECKAHLIKKGYVNVLKAALEASMESSATLVAGLAAVSALTLRSPENSRAFFDGGIPEIIVESMRRHPDEKPIHKTASWAIRNMVSRSKYQIPKFLELGVEEILQNDLKKFKDIEYDVKAALRDLGCKVNFKEEWTGKGGALTSKFDRNEDDD